MVTKIDICIPTLNKELTAEKMLEIEDFTKYIPVNNIIFSTVKGLANSRNDLMSKVETEWFIFLDDDVKLNKKWWDKIKVYIDAPHIGAVNGLGLSDSKLLNFIRFSLLKLRGTKNQRGFTSNTLIRTEAVKGIVLKRVGRLEDAELQDGIMKNGYIWAHNSNAICKHLKHPKTVWREAWGDFRTLWKDKGFFGAIKSI